MPEYRVYIIGSDGHFFRSAVPLDCADDEEAIKRSKQLFGGHDVELWQHDRKVVRFKQQR
jgi:hypothetical protein